MDRTEETIRPAQPGAVPYSSGRLNLRDDLDDNLEAALIALAQRRNGRRMIERLLASGFVTVLVSTRLRPMQAGLWGPIFFHGRVVGATLSVDLEQIRRRDHDPTGIETLAHELRHQVDAARAFRNKGDYPAVHRAALSGDLTGSAQQYAERLCDQRPDLDPAAARAWLEPRLYRFDPTPSHVVASVPRTGSPD
ncbi:MAG: hypothetical protein R3244_00580 [Thermoanaerobaculia bacterium]|nr:hypothetical protein [Thermoanaerobaculia bacterium]